MKINHFFKIILALLFVCETSIAQLPLLGAQGLMNGAEYSSGRSEGKPLIKVNLIGGVRLPGVYHVPIDTNLAEVLSYAGGAVEGATLDEVRVRSVLGSKISFKTYDFIDISKSAMPYPTLANGDIIQIDVEKDQLARTALWVSLLGSIVSVALAVAVYNSRQ